MAYIIFLTAAFLMSRTGQKMLAVESLAAASSYLIATLFLGMVTGAAIVLSYPATRLGLGGVALTWAAGLAAGSFWLARERPAEKDMANWICRVVAATGMALLCVDLWNYTHRDVSRIKPVQPQSILRKCFKT